MIIIVVFSLVKYRRYAAGLRILKYLLKAIKVMVCTEATARVTANKPWY